MISLAKIWKILTFDVEIQELELDKFVTIELNFEDINKAIDFL